MSDGHRRFHRLVDAELRDLDRIRWRRHATPTSIVRAFLWPIARAAREPLLTVLCDIGDGVPRTFDQLRATVRDEGMWGFADHNKDPGTIHWWHDGRRTPNDLAILLGHELGHLTGKRLRHPIKEELRANKYGAVAAKVLAMLAEHSREITPPRRRKAGVAP